MTIPEAPHLPGPSSGESSYTRDAIGPEAIRFTVHPVNVGSGGAFILHLFLAIATFMFIGSLGNPEAGLALAIGAFFLLRLFRKASVTAERAAGGTFVIDSVGLAWDKYQVPRQDISGFVIKPAYEHKVDQSKARMWKVNRLQDSSWQLIMEYSGRGQVIAGGMTEHTARGLMRDVLKTLG